MRTYERLAKDFLATVLEAEGPEAMWRASKAEAVVQMMKLWQEAGRAKAAATVEYVTDLTDQGRKVVVFYYHQSSLEALLTALAKEGTEYTVISGAVTGDARERAIDDFQNGTAQVMLAQIKAAGMAVTLTAAADAVFHQVPWSAGDLKQAADRILRVDDPHDGPGQGGEQITWHVLQACLEDGTPTIDGVMFEVLETKARRLRRRERRSARDHGRRQRHARDAHRLVPAGERPLLSYAHHPRRAPPARNPLPFTQGVSAIPPAHSLATVSHP